MRVQIIASETWSFMSGVNLNVVFKAEETRNKNAVTITSEQLHSAGAHERVFDCESWWFSFGDVKVLPNIIKATGDKDMLNVEESERRYCITDKCCNQFGERDEMQSIINSLQADVIARDARIAELEREQSAMRSKFDALYDTAEKAGVCSEFLRVNFACEWGDNA